MPFEEPSLVRLFPEQIEEKWELIAPMLAQSLPPWMRVQRDTLTCILEKLLLEEATLWCLRRDDKLYGLVMLSELEDKVIGLRALLVYSIYALIQITPELWEEGLETLKTFARSRGYSGIVAFSNIPGIIAACDRSGARTEFHLIEFEV